MDETTHRQHYLPVRRDELIDLLCQLDGVSAIEQKQWRIISRLLASLFHFEFLRTIDELSEDYAPFDPDRETAVLRETPALNRVKLLDKLFTTSNKLLVKANFEHISEDEIKTALTKRSRWGLSMDVDFNIFDRLAVFIRGKTTGKRSFRNWRRLWKMEEVDVPIYRRLIIMLKLREDAKIRIGSDVDSADVYLKAFKDIPQEDLEMLLPGAKLKMSNLDKTKLSLPILMFLMLVAWNGVIVPVLKFLGLGFIQGPVGAGAIGIWGIAIASGTYGYRSYYTYNFTKNQYSLQLTRSLYYQNLDNNAGVLYSLLSEAEHQEWREAILGYFCLWKFAPHAGWNAKQLDKFIEKFLEEHIKLQVDFEIADALKKLERFGLVTSTKGRLKAISLEKAVEKLHDAWEKEFKQTLHRGNEPSQDATSPTTPAR